MIIIKNISVFLLSLLIIVSNVRAQQQHHIPWPSLADSPWPIGRGDAQATGRSKYVGPRTANVLWRKDMPLGILYGPVIGYNDNLFIGSYAANFSGSENYFYSIDKNGEDIWTFVTEGYRANVAGPTVAKDSTIYFASLSSGIYASNPNGTLKWRNERFIIGLHRRYISVSKNDNVYIPWIDTIYVLDPDNGSVTDSVYLPGIYGKEIVFSTGGDTIFYITSGALIAAKIDGELLWSYSLGNNSGVPAVDNNNRIYLYGSQSGSRYLFSINPDGTVNWQYLFDTPAERFENYSSPTVDKNGNIIFQTSTEDSGYIYSVDYYGNLNWKTTLGHYWEDGAFINHGLVCDAEGKVYCGSSLGLTTNFWCLDNDGTILWKLDLEGYEYDTSPAIDSDGTIYIGTHLSSSFQNHVRNLIAIRDTVTSVENYDEEIFNYVLEQNYPNPFNSLTHIRYSIHQSGNVSLKVFDILGKEVAYLVNRYQDSGKYDVMFDAGNLPSGIYFYRLISGTYTETKKFILLR